MIRSIIAPLTLILLSAYFLYFEFLSISQLITQNKYEKKINDFLLESRFLKSSDRISKLSEILSTINNKKIPFEHRTEYEAGKINLLLGLENPSSDKKMRILCTSREKFKSAAALSPRNINYQLSLTDIESISPYLAQTCDQLNNNEINNLNSAKNTSLAERLNWIESLGPLDPPTLYKKGLIEKAIGQRLNAMSSFRKFDEMID